MSKIFSKGVGGGWFGRLKRETKNELKNFDVFDFFHLIYWTRMSSDPYIS